MSFGDHIETRSELEAAELDRENRVADRLATNAPELDWIVATEIQRRAEEHPHAYPRGTAPAMAHLIERDRELRDVKQAYAREVELADRRAAELVSLDTLIVAGNAAIARNSLANIQAWLDACGQRGDQLWVDSGRNATNDDDLEGEPDA